MLGWELHKCSHVRAVGQELGWHCQLYTAEASLGSTALGHPVGTLQRGGRCRG